ncbi:MAG: outer membrane beta-barrel protein, partial [Phycisphaerae bacterium]|nr:porin family protein [Phycisphaerae bacterium]NIR50047.1 porin family protein [candidate division KSB1 bacterium]NIS25497.1 porin family protein [candidate division KSB1 bacterium]NIU26176.1 porin family protein [candidate division KSB1 bacterium]NIV00208.1 outer membrane beta-barrel protein [Phycisphaerae bacterium]
FATSASAQNMGPYFNLSIGQSDVDTNISDFDKSTSFSLGFGYSINKNLAIEASYIDFGDAEDDITPVWTLSADALVASVIGKIPFNPMVTGYGKIGIASWDAELAEDGFGTFATDDGSDVTFG